ncbi:MAG: glycosyltransferase [Bacteroidales bacterium]|jgi:glycosyltransferase involved in cell wall biosynthesis|nr:glycosyltransferase [Bacteroidales bacterium]
MNKLTAIIPFLNEGIEIERTLESIRETAENKVDIIVINDNSQDDTDYESVAKKYNARYYYNVTRQGVAQSRNIGVELCETPYFILFDGHMRFYHNDWWNETVKALDDNDRATYCLRCLPLDDKFQLMENTSMGACINMDEAAGNAILDPAWRYGNNEIDKLIIQIPCVLGACYALSKRYWTYLKGLTGLKTYGCDEAYLSLKTWLEGGSCLLFKEIKVGHIFRPKAPYSMSSVDLMYNKLLMAESVLPYEQKKTVFSNIQKSNSYEFTEAMKLLVANKKLVAELKSYYLQIFTSDIDSFIKFNQDMKQ